MKHLILRLAAILLTFPLTSLAHAACKISSPGLSPALIIHNTTSGANPHTAYTRLDVECTSPDALTISTASRSYTSRVGNRPDDEVTVAIFKDSTLTQLLHDTPINRAVSAGRISTPLYLRISGRHDGKITGMGYYKVTLPITVTSSTVTGSVNVEVSGTVEGTCSLNEASVNFGNIENGTKPVRPLSLSIKCSQGLPWSLRQASIVQFGPQGPNNTAWMFSNPSGNTNLFDTPLLGTGTGANQTVSVYIGLNGRTKGSPVTGIGNFHGSMPITITY